MSHHAAGPFVIFELVTALQLGKRIVFLHRESGVGGLAPERTEEVRLDVQSPPAEQTPPPRSGTAPPTAGAAGAAGAAPMCTLPAEELLALRRGNATHDGLVKEVVRHLQSSDVEAAIAQLHPSGLPDSPKEPATWSEVMERRAAAAMTGTAAAAARLHRRALSAPQARTEPYLVGEHASVEGVERLLELLLGLFERMLAPGSTPSQQAYAAHTRLTCASVRPGPQRVAQARFPRCAFPTPAPTLTRAWPRRRRRSPAAPSETSWCRVPRRRARRLRARRRWRWPTRRTGFCRPRSWSACSSSRAAQRWTR